MSHSDIFWRSGCVSSSTSLPHHGVPGRADPTLDVVKCADSPLAAPGKTRALVEQSVLDVGANVAGGFARQNVDVVVDVVVDAAADAAVDAVVDAAADAAVEVVVDAAGGDAAVDAVVDSAADAAVEVVVDVVVDAAADAAVDVVDAAADVVDVAGVPAVTDADVVNVHAGTDMAGTQDAVASGVVACGDVVAALGYVLGVDTSVDAADALAQASNEVSHHSEPWTIKKFQLCIFHIFTVQQLLSRHVPRWPGHPFTQNKGPDVVEVVVLAYDHGPSAEAIGPCEGHHWKSIRSQLL